MALTKLVNGVPVEMTPEEEAAFEASRAPLRADVVAGMWSRIKAERERRRVGGVLVSGKWFHSDDSSRIQQLGLVMMGASVPAVPWKTMDGTTTTMSQALANSIFQAVAAADQTNFGVAESHRVAMEASGDPANYDFSTGWKAIYL